MDFVSSKMTSQKTSKLSPPLTRRSIIVWLDPKKDPSSEHLQTSLDPLRHYVNGIHAFDCIDECVRCLHRKQKHDVISLILNRPIDQQDVRLVHLVEVIDRIDAIYVLSSNVDEHNDRRKGMLKFKGFFPDTQQLIDALEQDLVLSAKNNPSSMSIVSAASSETDEPDVLFTYSKNLVDLLRRIDYDQSDRKDFCKLLREDFDGD